MQHSNEEYLSQKSFMGQRVLQYVQRGNAPYVDDFGERRQPYAEGFEARHLVNPILSDNLFFDSELKELSRTVAWTD